MWQEMMGFWDASGMSWTRLLTYRPADATTVPKSHHLLPYSDPDLQNILRFIIRLSEVYRKINLRQ